MKVHKFCLIIIYLVLYGGAEDSYNCDKIQDVYKLPEGNAGQTANYPWLGLLRVHLHTPHAKRYRVAVTGVVLIKNNYVLAVSSDVAKIPKHILRDDSKIMFISAFNTPTYAKAKDYLNHPEFEILTLNTISIIEIEVPKDFNIKPICWPRLNYNTKGDLYAIGYTDVHEVLEKEIFKLQFIEKPTCDEFYVRSNLNEDLKPPTRYQCAFAVHSNASCIVESGMAIVSNATGYWTLIGLSVHGPGCAAPNRFIELSTFLPWLTTSVTIAESDIIMDDDGPDLKLLPEGKMDMGLADSFAGFRRKPGKQASKESIVVPVHTLFKKQQHPGSNRNSMQDDAKPSFRQEPYSLQRHVFGHPNQYDYYVPTWMDRYLSKHFKTDYFWPGKAVIEFDTMLEYKKGGCRYDLDLIYNDVIKITNHNIDEMHEAVYGLSLFDVLYRNVSCLKVEIDSFSREKVKVWHEPVFNTYLTNQRQPPETLKKKVFPPIQPHWYNSPEDNTSGNDDYKEPKYNKHLSPAYIVDEIMERRIPNINILIRFRYYEKAKMVLTLYGRKSQKTSLRTDGAGENQEMGNLLQKIKEDKVKNLTHDDIQRAFWSDEIIDVSDNTTDNKNVTWVTEETPKPEIELEFEKPLFDNLNYYARENYIDKLYSHGDYITSNILLILPVVGGVIAHNSVID